MGRSNDFQGLSKLKHPNLLKQTSFSSSSVVVDVDVDVEVDVDVDVEVDEDVDDSESDDDEPDMRSLTNDDFANANPQRKIIAKRRFMFFVCRSSLNELMRLTLIVDVPRYVRFHAQKQVSCFSQRWN